MLYNEKISRINISLDKQEVLFTPAIDNELEEPDSFMIVNDD
jgi:hypothetical protein